MMHISTTGRLIFKLMLLQAVVAIVSQAVRLGNHLNLESQIDRINAITEATEFCLSIREKIYKNPSALERFTGYFRLSSKVDTFDAEACRETVETQLKDLKNVINTDGSDLCSKEKISAIEQFHYDYVEPNGKYYMEKRSKRYFTSFLMLNNYFMLYVSELSAICEQVANENFDFFIKDLESNLSKELEKDEDTKKSKSPAIIGSHDLKTLDNFLDSIGKIFFITTKPNYENMFMPWKLLRVLYQNKNFQFNLFYKLGQRLSVQMRYADHLIRLQNFCRNFAEPTYAGSLLPVMLLVHLGYYPKSTKFTERIAESKFAKRGYMFAHICELVLPLEPISNEKLGKHEIIVLKKEDLPAQHTDTNLEVSSNKPDEESISAEDDTLDFDDSMYLNEGDAENVRKIKADIQKRRKRMESLLWILLTRIKRHFDLKEFFDTLKKSRKEKKHHQQIIEELEIKASSGGIFWKIVYYVGMKFFVNVSVKALIASVVIYNKLLVEPYLKLKNKFRRKGT